MHKITSNSMLMELAGITDAVAATLNVHPEIVEQILLAIILEMSNFSNLIKAAYKRDYVLNECREANRERDDAISLVTHLARGFARYPKSAEPEKREAGARIYAVIRKYRRLSHLSYDAQSAAMLSLYDELRQPRLEADIRLLGDSMANAVALIETTDRAFMNARAEYSIRYEQRGPSACYYRKRLLDLFNNSFVPYLTALMNVDEATYGAFGREVEARIVIANRTVRQRAERKKAARAGAASIEEEKNETKANEQKAEEINEATQPTVENQALMEKSTNQLEPHPVNTPEAEPHRSDTDQRTPAPDSHENPPVNNGEYSEIALPSYYDIRSESRRE